MKSSFGGDIMSCVPSKVDRSFGETYRLHLQSRRINQVWNGHKAGSKHTSAVILWLAANMLLDVLFDPEDGGDMFLRSVGWFSPGYMVWYPEDRIPHRVRTLDPRYKDGYVELRENIWRKWSWPAKYTPDIHLEILEILKGSDYGV
jgi:hypothetical protein